MEIILAAVTSIIILFFIVQFTMILKSKKQVGRQIPFDKLTEITRNKIMDKTFLLYFFSPSCRACKYQTPIMTGLKNKAMNVLLIDISKDITDARAFGIMGTPTTIIVKSNFIKDIFVGAKDEKFLLDKLLE